MKIGQVKEVQYKLEYYVEQNRLGIKTEFRTELELKDSNYTGQQIVFMQEDLHILEFEFILMADIYA